MQSIQRAMEFSTFEITSNFSRSRQDRTSDWKWSKCSVLQELELSTTTRKFEVLGAYITRNLTINTTIYSRRDWPPDFWSRIITVESTSLEIDPAKALTEREFVFTSITRHSTKVLRHTGFHNSDGAVPWHPLADRGEGFLSVFFFFFFFFSLFRFFLVFF